MNAIREKTEREKIFADATHPRVRSLARDICRGLPPGRERLDALFRYVRDEIPFGFPPRWNEDAASDVLDNQQGDNIGKSILFQALCLAAGQEARIRFGFIRRGLMRGVIPGWARLLMPGKLLHAWVEIRLDGEWAPVDAYINDMPLYRAARHHLEDSGRSIGYSLACTPAAPCHYDWQLGYNYLGALAEGHGAWEDAADYFASPAYRPLPPWLLWLYPLVRKAANYRVRNLRYFDSI